MNNRSIGFFEAQFQRQVRDREHALNPFETLALDHVAGRVLDLGCGLGNLSLEAARRGHSVVAVDASPTAIEHIRYQARQQGLAMEAVQADISVWTIDRSYDTILAIGLLMFFRRERALEILRDIREHVTPGGRAVVNVLVEGTTFMEMFDPHNHCLFGRDEIEDSFADWRVLVSRHDSFSAPAETRKEFATVVVVKPGSVVPGQIRR